MQKMQAMRADTNTKLEAILTDDQKAHWKDMLGTPLPLAAGGFGGRRRNNNN